MLNAHPFEAQAKAMEPAVDEIPRVSYRTQAAIENDVDDAADQHADDDQLDNSQQIACCWLDKRLTASDLVMGIPAMVVGIGAVWFGFQNPGLQAG